MIYFGIVVYLIFIIGAFIWFDNQRSRSLVESISRAGNYNLSEKVYTYIKFLILRYKKRILDVYRNMIYYFYFKLEFCFIWFISILSKNSIFNRLCQVLEKKLKRLRKLQMNMMFS